MAAYDIVMPFLEARYLPLMPFISAIYLFYIGRISFSIFFFIGLVCLIVLAMAEILVYFGKIKDKRPDELLDFYKMQTQIRIDTFTYLIVILTFAWLVIFIIILYCLLSRGDIYSKILFSFNILAFIYYTAKSCLLVAFKKKFF